MEPPAVPAFVAVHPESEPATSAGEGEREAGAPAWASRRSEAEASTWILWSQLPTQAEGAEKLPMF